MMKSDMIDLRPFIDDAYLILCPHFHNHVTTFQGTFDDTDRFFNHHHVAEYLKRYIDDYLNDLAEYVKEKTRSAEAYLIERLCYSYMVLTNHAADDLSNLYLRHMLDQILVDIDEVLLELNERLESITHNHGWWIWELKRGRDYVVLKSIEDWRVKIFNEKIDSGEWKL